MGTVEPIYYESDKKEMVGFLRGFIVKYHRNPSVDAPELSVEEIWQYLEGLITNPLDAQVSFAEPNQQLFTIAEVNELLEEQKSICARESKVRYIHKKVNLDKQAKIFRDDNFEQSWTTDERTIVNAPPPQKFIDRIIVKS